MKGWKVVSYSVQCINLEEGEYVKKKNSAGDGPYHP